MNNLIRFLAYVILMAMITASSVSVHAVWQKAVLLPGEQGGSSIFFILLHLAAACLMTMCFLSEFAKGKEDR